MFAHNMNSSFRKPDEKLQTSLKQLILHETMKTYQPPSGVRTKAALQALQTVEPVTDNKSRFVVNLKLCLMWLIGDFTRHLANSNAPN